MLIEWSDELATGSAKIDEQHKELFKRINALLEACRLGKGNAEIEKMMQFLNEYVVVHFSEEENYMLRYSYPGYERHKAEHIKFMENFRKLKAEFDNDGPGFLLVLRTKEMIIQWLLDHIRKIDRALGSFEKNRSVT
jgi:hemerythrin